MLPCSALPRPEDQTHTARPQAATRRAKFLCVCELIYLHKGLSLFIKAIYFLGVKDSNDAEVHSS